MENPRVAGWCAAWLRRGDTRMADSRLNTREITDTSTMAAPSLAGLNCLKNCGSNPTAARATTGDISWEVAPQLPSRITDCEFFLVAVDIRLPAPGMSRAVAGVPGYTRSKETGKIGRRRVAASKMFAACPIALALHKRR